MNDFYIGTEKLEPELQPPTVLEMMEMVKAGGWRQGNFSVLSAFAGPSHEHKSSIVMSMAERLVREGKPVMWMNTEMVFDEKRYRRLFARKVDIDLEAMEDEEVRLAMEHRDFVDTTDLAEFQ